MNNKPLISFIIFIFFAIWGIFHFNARIVAGFKKLPCFRYNYERGPISPILAKTKHYELPAQLLKEDKYEECIIAAEAAAICYLEDKENKNDTLYFYCYTLIAKALTELDRQADFLKYEREVYEHYFLNDFAIMTLKNMALAYKEAGNNAQAQGYFQRAISEAKRLAQQDKTGESDYVPIEIDNDMGFFYAYLGDFTKALTYYDHSLQALLLAEKKDSAEIQKRYVSKSVTYQEIEEYESALQDIHRAKMFAAEKDLKDIYIELINIHTSLNNIDSADTYLQKMLPFVSKLSPSEQGRCKKFEGEVAFAKKNYLEAEKEVQVSIFLRKGDNKGLLHSYLLLGEIYYQQQNLKSALFAFQNALKYAAFNKENPLVKDIVLKKEAIQIYQNIISIQKTQKYNKQALELCDTTDRLITYLRELYQSDGSKLILADKVAAFYHTAMQLALEVGDKEKAFYFSEKSKGFLLFSAIKDLKYKQISNISQDTLDKEQALLQEITWLKNKGKEDKIFELSQDLDALKRRMAIQNPAYYRLKHQTKPVTLRALQQKLTAEQAIIEYVRGEMDGAWVVTKDTAVFVDLPMQVSDSAVLAFYRFMADKNTDLTPYLSKAYPFYEALILPIEKIAKQPNWIIIPDGTLNYLPFEALPNPDRVKPYLLYEKNISYHYSASLWEHLGKTVFTSEQKNNYFVAAVDKFDNGMGTLQGGKSLIETLKNYLGMGENIFPAQKQPFMQHFQQEKTYPLLCLYTHSKADDYVAEKSVIHFKDDVLNLSEVFSLRMKAGLVILASCESGKGKIHNGEGMSSLARGFMYAGGESVLPTKWTVSEKQTNALLTLLIAELAQGTPKDKALQQVKIKYLQQNPQATPYEWAAPFLVGNTEAIHFQETNNTWKIIFVVSLLSFGVLFIILWRYKA